MCYLMCTVIDNHFVFKCHINVLLDGTVTKFHAYTWMMYTQAVYIYDIYTLLIALALQAECSGVHNFNSKLLALCTLTTNSTEDSTSMTRMTASAT